MRVGSVWLPIVFCLGMMAVCCGGPMLVGRWQRARRRPPSGPPAVNVKAAAADAGQKEWIDG
jgi:hypothetical protein